MKQCINTLPAQLNIDCLSTCGTPKNKKCDGNLASCVTIPYCGAGASCNKKSGRCKCAAGMLGNGQQCFEGDCPGANCTLVANAEDNVEISIDTQSEYFVYTQKSEL